MNGAVETSSFGLGGVLAESVLKGMLKAGTGWCSDLEQGRASAIF